MGLFDIFKKKKVNDEIGSSQLNSNSTMSIDSNSMDNNSFGNVNIVMDELDRVLDQIYPIKKDITISDSILKRISVYSQNYYWHFVTHGLQDKYQMELTYKLKMDDNINDDREINCACEILKFLAKIIEEKNEPFIASQYIRTNNAISMDAEAKSNITGFITIDEPIINNASISGMKIKLIELVGATDIELKAIMNNQMTVDDLYQKLGTDITDYSR